MHLGKIFVIFAHWPALLLPLQISRPSLFSQSLSLIPHSSLPFSLLYQIIQLDQSTLNPNYSIKSSNWISPLRTLTHHRPNSKSTQTPEVQKPISFSALISLYQYFFFSSPLFFCVFFLPFTSRNHKKQLEIFKIFKGCF